MAIIARVLTLIIALLHAGFLVLEMFLWSGPIGQRVFALTPEFAEQSAVLAANQGLYNGLLAAGLAWAGVSGRRDLMIFFLACVIVVGVFGAATANLSILFVQAGPAFVALAFVLAARKSTSGSGAGAPSSQA